MRAVNTYPCKSKEECFQAPWELREGDTFTLTILNETLTYEVDHIWIVEPTDLTHLQIEDGKELCTLITCTPYGINTHRLLVQAHRIENLNSRSRHGHRGSS